MPRGRPPRPAGTRRPSDRRARVVPDALAAPPWVEAPQAIRGGDRQNLKASRNPPQWRPSTVIGAAASFMTTKLPPPMSRR